MTQGFRAQVREAATPLLGRCGFPAAGDHIDCAVSGGADSLALLMLAFAAGCNPVAHHVDHGLRQSSCTDVEVVNEVAGALGAEVAVYRVEVGPGSNLEARAREARLGVLPAGAATGHTADDQAETVLVNLLRGAATDGLAAMRAGPRHPILGLRRAETHALCDQLEVRPVVDETNADPAYVRNRIRLELLPLLCQIAKRDLVPVLARQAGLMGDDARLLEELAGTIEPTDARAISVAPPALARRALRGWLRSGHPPDSATVERVLAVAMGTVLAAEVGAGRTVRRSRGRLRLEQEPARPQSSDEPCCGPSPPR